MYRDGYDNKAKLMLEVKNISAGYGKKQVLYDVSFNVNAGEIVLLTGGNGSGKSTILKCIYGLLPLWGGEIFFNGENLVGFKTSDMIKKGIVYIPQKNNYFENLTVQENLEVSGSIYSTTELKLKIDTVYTEIPKIFAQKKRTPFNLSGGERQLLAFGMALIHEPKLILFDEPTAGLSPNNIETILTLINTINNRNTMILLIEHKVQNVKSITNKIHIIVNGKLN